MIKTHKLNSKGWAHISPHQVHSLAFRFLFNKVLYPFPFHSGYYNLKLFIIHCSKSVSFNLLVYFVQRTTLSEILNCKLNLINHCPDSATGTPYVHVKKLFLFKLGKLFYYLILFSLFQCLILVDKLIYRNCSYIDIHENNTSLQDGGVVQSFTWKRTMSFKIFLKIIF